MDTVSTCPTCSPELAADIWKVMERLQSDIAPQIRALLGQHAYDPRMFDEKQQALRIEALKICAYGVDDTVARHEAWMAQHIADGWKYGPEFKPELKEHNNLLPYEQLPADAKVKAQIFSLVAKTTANLLATVAKHEASHEVHDTCGGCDNGNCAK